MKEKVQHSFFCYIVMLWHQAVCLRYLVAENYIPFQSKGNLLSSSLVPSVGKLTFAHNESWKNFRFGFDTLERVAQRLINT